MFYAAIVDLSNFEKIALLRRGGAIISYFSTGHALNKVHL